MRFKRGIKRILAIENFAKENEIKIDFEDFDFGVFNIEKHECHHISDTEF